MWPKSYFICEFSLLPDQDIRINVIIHSFFLLISFSIYFHPICLFLSHFILRSTLFFLFQLLLTCQSTFKALSLSNNTHILLFLKFLLFFSSFFFTNCFLTQFSVWLIFVLPQLPSPNIFPQIWDKLALNHDGFLQPKERYMEIIIQ